MTLEEMKNVDITKIDPSTLVDIRDVHIPNELTGDERIKEFIKQIKNPYCYRIGDVVIKNAYADDGPELEECFRQIIMTM